MTIFQVLGLPKSINSRYNACMNAECFLSCRIGLFRSRLIPGQSWIICGLISLLFLTGCVPESLNSNGSAVTGQEPSVWVVSDMVALTDQTAKFSDDSILANVAGQPRINLFAAGNETVSFQVIIDAPISGAKQVSVSAGALSAGKPGDVDTPTIAAENIRTFRMLPVRITKFPAWYLRQVDTEPQPASFYDALLPTDAPQGGQPYTLKSNERLAVWVDVNIPRAATPGLYSGIFSVATGAGKSTEIGIELKVFNFVLPETRPLAAMGAFDHKTLFREFITQADQPYTPEYLDAENPKVQQGLAIIRQMMRLSHEHRLDLFDRELHPKIHRDLYGNLVLDWSDFDKIVEPYISGKDFEDRIGVSAWPIPFSQTWPVPKYYGGIDSEYYASTAEGIISQCVKHFQDQLKSQEQVFAWPYRDEVSADAFEQYIRLAEIVKKSAPALPVLCELPINPPAMTGWETPQNFTTLVDILAPPAQWFDPSQAEILRTPENPLMGVWLSPGMPPYLPSLSIIATPADVRAIPWFAMKYKCSGIFLPNVLNWSGDVFNTPAGAETRLFYPGKAMGIQGVLSSVRLKRLRRGMEDIAYIWILRQREHEDTALNIMNSMVRYAGLASAGDNYLDPRIAGWVQHGPTWVRVRKLLADEVLSAVHDKTKTEQQKIADRVRWQQFSSKAHKVRVERMRSQMSQGQPLANKAQPGKPETKPWRANIFVDLYNEYDRPLDCLLEITSLPQEWKALDTNRRIQNFPPDSQRVVKLTVEGMELPVTANGKVPIELKLTTNAPSQTVMRTDVPFIHTSQIHHPPSIDGQLEDWPVRPAMSAGDFRLLGKRGQKIGNSLELLNDKDKTGLAKRQTVAFAMVDKENLYFAIRCEEPNLKGMVFNNSNTVQYEQLLACGEDLVEIILDPGVRAKSPEDLYHIIVKPNGIIVEEKGVRSTPPLGKAVPFPLGTTVAVGRQTDAWVVEMKIRRSSFGPVGLENFWGVNFTRFATQGMEASSWSGAARYFYNPETLGTMFVLPPVD